jgi:cell division protein ZapA (FtsZ GTPase activity inhibitor)
MLETNDIRRVSVSIVGRRFVVTTDQAEDKVQALARMVDEKVAAVTPPSGVSGMNELMLAALTLADDLRLERERYAELKGKIRAQSESLLSRLDVDRYRDLVQQSL